MTTNQSSQAIWEAMTEEQREDWVMVNILGYVRRADGTFRREDFTTASRISLTDWNHWRQVEEKVMEDQKLFQPMLMLMSGENVATRMYNWIEADLPTRAQALFIAYSSLHAH